MATDTNDTDLRKGLHGMWAAVAPGWAEHADYVDERSADITERLLDLAAVAPGMRVLELACGPGSVGIAASERVGPHGEVVVSDVAPEMTEIAAARAAERGHANITARVLDLEEIAEPDAGYDAVVCREGLMFATDHARAAREIARVLRPGGRAAIAVWAERERNPWLTVLLDSVGEQLGATVPPPGVPGPFSLSDAGDLERLLSDCGFSDAAVSEMPIAMRVDDFDAWWTRTCALAGPVSRILDALPEEGVQQIRARAAEAVEGYRDGGAIELPGVTLVAGAARGQIAAGSRQ